VDGESEEVEESMVTVEDYDGSDPELVKQAMRENYAV